MSNTNEPSGGVSVKPRDESDNLFQIPKSLYGPLYEGHLLEQYKIAVQMADNVSGRRITANEFFLGVNSVLASLAGAAVAFGGSAQGGLRSVSVSLSVVGIIFSAVWILTLSTYRELNRAKFEVINRLERHLPAAPFLAEWESISPAPSRGTVKPTRYMGLTSVESLVPGAFVLLYVILLVGVLLGAL